MTNFGQVFPVLAAIDKGAAVPELAYKTSLSPSELQKVLQVLREKNLVVGSSSSVRLTEKGTQLRNTLMHSPVEPSSMAYLDLSADVDAELDRIIAGLK